MGGNREINFDVVDEEQNTQTVTTTVAERIHFELTNDNLLFENKNYEASYEFAENVTIEEVYTDEENLYFRLSNNQYLLHGMTNIDFNGVLSAGVRILSREQFRLDYGESFLLDPSIRKLKTDPIGNSI